MLIAQITDTHIKPKGGLAYGNIVDTASSLKNIVDHCNKFNPKIDLVIVTGDLVADNLYLGDNEWEVVLSDQCDTAGYTPPLWMQNQVEEQTCVTYLCNIKPHQLNYLHHDSINK